MERSAAIMSLLKKNVENFFQGSNHKHTEAFIAKSK
jgi:hypothetical protein